MKRLVLIALLLPCFLTNNAQEFAKFRNKKKQNPFTKQWFLVYARFTSTDGKYVDPQTYPSIGFSIRDDSYKKKGLRWRFDHPSLSDLIYLLASDGQALWNNKKAWLDLSAAVDISLVKVTDPSTNYKETPSYPKPVFATFAAQLNTTQRLFTGVRLVRMLDNGGEKDKAGRFDFSLGMSF